MKMLRITGCNDPQRWYADMVGHIVPLGRDTSPGEYQSKEPGGYINFVQHCDAEIVEVTNLRTIDVSGRRARLNKVNPDGTSISYGEWFTNDD